jgi:hypothetical protein
MGIDSNGHAFAAFIDQECGDLLAEVGQAALPAASKRLTYGLVSKNSGSRGTVSPSLELLPRHAARVNLFGLDTLGPQSPECGPNCLKVSPPRGNRVIEEEDKPFHH